MVQPVVVEGAASKPPTSPRVLVEPAVQPEHQSGPQHSTAEPVARQVPLGSTAATAATGTRPQRPSHEAEQAVVVVGLATW